MGFRLLIVDSDGVDPKELVVAYILSDSDLIAKTFDGDRIAYKHRRWGIPANSVNDDEEIDDDDLTWTPLGFRFYYEPAEAIQKGDWEPDERAFEPIIPRKFHYEDYDPEIHGN